MGNEEHSVNFVKKAFEFQNLKLYKEAIEMLYKALSCEDIGHSAGEIVSQIGDLYFLLKNYERAQENYEKVLAQDKTNSHALFQLCEIYFSEKKFEQALSLIKELCETSTRETVFIKYFLILYNLQKFEDMKNAYESLSPELKKNSEILYLMSLSDKERRLEFLIKTLEASPDNIQANYDLGVCYFNENKISDSKKYFEYILSQEENPSALNYLGLIAQKEGKYSLAIDYFFKATKLNQTNGEYYLNLARAYLDIYWLDEAQIAIQKSIKVTNFLDKCADLSEHYYSLAWINRQRKNYKNAILNLDLINKNSAFYEEARILRNIIDLELGDIVSAKVRLENLYSNVENQKNSNLISSLGKIYKELKMFSKSINMWEEGLKIHPDSFEFLNELIYVLIEDKNYDYALQIADKFKKLYPTNSDVYNSYARIFYRQKKYKEALNELMKLTQLDQNNAEAYYFMGLILNDMKESVKAQENLKAAINLNPCNAKYYAQYARSYTILGDFESALLYIKEALDIKPEEIGYVKTAKEYCEKLNDKNGSEFYQNLSERLEKLLKTKKK